MYTGFDAKKSTGCPWVQPVQRVSNNHLSFLLFCHDKTFYHITEIHCACIRKIIASKSTVVNAGIVRFLIRTCFLNQEEFYLPTTVDHTGRKTALQVSLIVGNLWDNDCTFWYDASYIVSHVVMQPLPVEYKKHPSGASERVVNMVIVHHCNCLKVKNT